METLSRRKYERMPFSTDMEIVEVETGQRSHGRSVDLSRGGVGFYAEPFIPAGTHIRATLRVPVNGRTVTISLGATVIWATAEGSGGIMGAQFDTALNPIGQPVLCELVDAV